MRYINGLSSHASSDILTVPYEAKSWPYRYLSFPLDRFIQSFSLDSTRTFRDRRSPSTSIGKIRTKHFSQRTCLCEPFRVRSVPAMRHSMSIRLTLFGSVGRASLDQKGKQSHMIDVGSELRMWG